MDLAEAGATTQLCLVDCWYDSTSARGCRRSAALWDDMRQSRKPNKPFSSQILEKIHEGDINQSKNKALDTETAGRKEIKIKRIKQLKDFKKYNYKNDLKLRI